ncbi:hypothetical protein CF68_20365 [Cupriavidus sp. SK-4]|uniref:hypothetical protein n=1 Tax=Cupriavidus sp. SK-4 TaxID=574750 RepID=UPI000447DF54|nr:hypothetical protein [Cupriavidus sp. SK-4]EYS96462.1 hypothetical protein CF68_20365 [Cupriavidus sp. SK-4]
MLATQSAVTVPPHIITCLNRAAGSAVRVLRRDHRMTVHSRTLRAQGAAWVQQAAAESSDHPTEPNALSLLEDILRDVMIESALNAQA